MTTSHAVVLACLLCVAVQARDNAPKPDADRDKEEKAARMEHMKQVARGYEITLASDDAKKLVLTEEPLLRFDDQVTGVVDGTVFVWMFEDRPAATASVWIRKTGHEFHEFQSLTVAGLIASNQGQPKWTPAQPGIDLKPAPIAQRPAATAAARLGQMRAFAREYSAAVIGPQNDRQELRLLTQPVVRYGRPDGAVVDGAMFAYCKGTNPEILLLVEAVRKDNELEWSYSFTRMTSRGCEVRREEKVVWDVPLLRGGSLTDPYFNVVLRYTGPGAKTPAPPDKDK